MKINKIFNRKSFITEFILLTFFIGAGLINYFITRTVAFNSVENKIIPLEVQTIKAVTKQFIAQKSAEISDIMQNSEFVSWRKSEKKPDIFGAISGALIEGTDFSRMDYADSFSEICYQFEGESVQMSESNPRDEWYYTFLNSKKLESINLFYDLTIDHLVVYINRKIYKSGVLQGVLGTAFYYDQLFDFFHVTETDSVYFYLADKDGNILFHPDTSFIGERNIYTWYGVEKDFESDKFIRITDKRTLKRVFIPELDLNLIIEFDRDLMKKNIGSQLHFFSLVVIFLAVLSGLFLVFANVFYRKRLHDNEIKLEEQLEIKNTMLHLLTHNIKNPLALTLNSSEKLILNSNNSETKSLATEIYSTSLEINELISNILLSNKSDSDVFNLCTQDFDISGLFEEIEYFYCRKLEMKQQQLILQCDGSVINTDKIYLKQILMNLVDNASKYSKPGSVIILSFDNISGKTIFRVEDCGPGFTDEDRAKVFNKFQTLSARPTGDEKSVGLGLHVAFKLAELLSGKLSIESTSSEGTVFKVELI